MTGGVVDGFEVVQVQQHKGKGLSLADSPVYMPQQGTPVGQPGQLVRIGDFIQPGGVDVTFAYIKIYGAANDEIQRLHSESGQIVDLLLNEYGGGYHYQIQN